MATADEYLTQFDQAMSPEPGFNQPSKHQTQIATAYAVAALAAAVLETGNVPDLDGVTIRPAIHHTA